MKKFGGMLILIGLAILIFFIYAKGKTHIEQKKLIDEYTSLQLSGETMKKNESHTPLKNGDTIGILEIPKISLKTPIVEGATQDNIRYAVGHIPSSSPITGLGKTNQNIAIAGHRSYTYGKFFNRLDELQKGDTIIVTIQKKVFTFKVMDKEIVDPTDVEVINPIKGKSIVTLITCHPMYSDKHRLIVFSELLSKETKVDNY